MIDALEHKEVRAEQEAKAHMECEIEGHFRKLEDEIRKSQVEVTKNMSTIGRKGGEATREKYGSEHYRTMAAERNSKISKEQMRTWSSKGGEALKVKYGPGHFKEMARRSVEARRRKKELLHDVIYTSKMRIV